MNERSKSDLLFEEDEEFIDALEEAVEKLSRITGEGEFIDDIERAAAALNNEYWRDKDKISLKTDEDEDPPLLIF